MTNASGAEKKGPRGEVSQETHDGLPDTRHPNGLCPQCGKQSSFEIRGTMAVTHEGRYAVGIDGSTACIDLDRVTVLICRHCSQGTAVIEKRVQESGVGMRPTMKPVYYQGVHWWPLPETQLPNDVPADIASAFAEATTTLYAQCPRATAVMARRTLEAVTANQGETQGVLAARLNNLATRGMLPPGLAEWAREVRVIGNTGAHYDLLSQVSMEDAQDLMNFLRDLLRYLYEIPAELQRRRAPK